MTRLLAVASSGMFLLGQVSGDTPVGWISNIGGLGLAAYLAGWVIPQIVRDHREAMKDLVNEIATLRVHCAAVTGREPGVVKTEE